MSASTVNTAQSPGKRKFQIGAQVRGKEEGPGSFRARTGTVVAYVARSREYEVSFDDGRLEYAYPHWLEAA